MATSGTVADWIPVTFGIVAGLLTLGLVFELMGDVDGALFCWRFRGLYDSVLSRLIEPSTTLSSRYAITDIPIEMSRCSMCRIMVR